MVNNSKKIATIDDKYYIFVANKAFLSYFESETIRCIQLMDFIHPDEADSFKEYLLTHKNDKKGKLFRFRKKTGEYCHNYVRVRDGGNTTGGVSYDIELVDIDDAVEAADIAAHNIQRIQAIMSITEEYIFSYNREDGVFIMYNYVDKCRNTLYRMDIDDWSRLMLKEGYVDRADKALFKNFITDMKSYADETTMKLKCAIRTQSDLKESLIFSALKFNDSAGEIMLGRITADNSQGQTNNALELMDELRYDSLTGVYNRKTIIDYANNALKTEKNNRVIITILDVDYFKKINDVYGHMTGDKVLARVGARLKEIVGEDGKVGRIGGDEFMIVFIGINDDQILRGVLRAIRTQIKWEFAEEFGDHNITCSIGAAICPNNGTEYEELFKKADYCLYVAKEKGRDRYVFFRDELHRQSYEESLTKEKKADNSREIRELQNISKFMLAARTGMEDAIHLSFAHILENFNVDNISVYFGEKLDRVYTVGKVINNAENASYIKGEEFTELLNGQKYFAEGYINKLTSTTPVFAEILKSQGVCSTIYCILGEDKIKGLVTYNRCKESAQWAEYELQTAIITSSLLSIIIDNVKKIDV